MRKSDISSLTALQLAEITGKSVTSIWKRCRRAEARGEMVIGLPGFGIYAFNHRGRNYLLVKIQSDSSEMLSFARTLRSHTCQNCRPVLSTIINNLESSQEA